MRRILIADDDFPIRDWLARNCEEILNKSADIEVVTASNGEQALKVFQEKKTDVVFADIRMPLMDGLELTHNIRTLDSEVYIVVLSSFDDFNYARTAFQNRVNEYVLKTEITVEYIRNILERASLQMKEREKQSDEASTLYSFDQIIEEFDEKASDTEKTALLDKYYIKKPESPFFCVANYNENQTYGSLRIIQEDGIFKVFSLRADKAEITCFAVSDTISMLYQFNKVNSFVKKIAGMNGSQIICYGRIGTNADNVLKYAIEVYRGLNYRYYSDEKVFFTETLQEEIREYDQPDEAVLSGFGDILGYQDKNNHDAVTEMIHGWFKLVKTKIILNITLIKSMCQRMIDAIYDGTGEQILENSDGTIAKRINRAEKLSELEELVIELYQERIMHFISSQTDSVTIQKALKYINRNYASISGLQEVAGHVGLNPEYFSRLFKDEVGINFSAYLNGYRLDIAEKMLQNTDKKLYEIAEATGFSSLSYFSRKFKERFNKAPFDYRG